MRDPNEKTLVTVVGKLPDLILPKAKDACLVMLYGPDLGKRYTISSSALVIGRSEQASIYVDRDSVSRTHAQIFHEGNSYIVEDMGSTNGTYVNDVQVTRRVLQDSDLIKIGEVIFKFLSRDNLENVYHEEIYRMAVTDGLTQIYNKRYFLDCIDREFSRSMRHNRPLSLILFDIDHFKALNDQYGHLAGDFVLKKTAQMVQKQTRCEDILSRYGGEEFALLLPETEQNQASHIAEKIRISIEEQQVTFENMVIQITSSFGVAVSNQDLTKSKQLIQLADEKLYDAKSSGRNCVRI